MAFEQGLSAKRQKEKSRDMIYVLSWTQCGTRRGGGVHEHVHVYRPTSKTQVNTSLRLSSSSLSVLCILRVARASCILRVARASAAGRSRRARAERRQAQRPESTYMKMRL
eukprot:3427534-Prymnesium_polylepis.1